MRRRGHRPEAPVCLEDRCLLSGAAGPSGDPVVISPLLLHNIEFQIRVSFQEDPRYHNMARLPGQLQQSVAAFPFGQAQGLGVAINNILDQMRLDYGAGVPHAIVSARDEVINVVRADLVASIRDGDVIVR